MAILKRTINGTEYTYAVVGKKHLFLGRSDDPRNIDKKNLDRALALMGKTVDKTLERYVRDIFDYSTLLDKSNAKEYLKIMQMKFIKCAKHLDNS